MKFFLLIKNKIWDSPFCLLSWNFIERNVAEEAPGKKAFLAQLNDFFLNKFSYLERRFILYDPDDTIL